MKTIKVITAAAAIALVSASCGLGNSGQSGPPESCVRALELADEGFRANSEGYAAVSQLLGADNRDDFDRASSQLDSAIEKFEKIGSEYNKAKTECRNSGQ
jgi:hypothetical protein